MEGLNKRYPLPPAPADFTVIATDGSHIDVDRHHSTRCYLINIGAVVHQLRQQAGRRAFQLLPASTPMIKTWSSPRRAAGASRRSKGTMLGAKRSIEECRHLAEFAAALPARKHRPGVARRHAYSLGTGGLPGVRHAMPCSPTACCHAWTP